MTYNPHVLWTGWADGGEHRAVLSADRTAIVFEAKREDALGEARWEIADTVKKHDQTVIFAALVGLGPKPTP